MLLFLTNQPGYQILKLDRPYYMMVGEYQGKLIHDMDKSYVQVLPEQNKQANPIVVSE